MVKMTNDKARSELEKIRVKNGGMLTEEAVVKAARSESHPLHGHFTWDDTEAAKQWRLEQARSLICRIYVTVESGRHQEVSIRAYASLPSDRKRGGGYRSIDNIMSNKRFRTELFASALAELESFKRRYSRLSRLAPVFTAIDKVSAGSTAKKPQRKVA